MPAGQPTDPHIQALAIDMVGGGRTRKATADSLGIPFETVKAWCSKDYDTRKLTWYLRDKYRDKVLAAAVATRKAHGLARRKENWARIEVAKNAFLKGQPLNEACKTNKVSLNAFYKRHPKYRYHRSGGRKADYHKPALNGITARNVVYFVQASGAGDFIKIGYATNLRNRMKQIRGGCPLPTVLLGYIHSPPFLERVLHRQFNSARVTNEWFNPVPELTSYINSKCA